MNKLCLFVTFSTYQGLQTYLTLYLFMLNFVVKDEDELKDNNPEYKLVKDPGSRFGMFDLIIITMITHLASLLWAQLIVLPCLKRMKKGIWLVGILGLLMLSSGCYLLSTLPMVKGDRLYHAVYAQLLVGSSVTTVVMSIH